MMISDLHMHSTFSDGKLSIPELVDLYGSRGFGAIAITDHLCEDETLIGKAAAYLGRTLTQATFPLYQEILRSEMKRAREQYNMLLIPGFELTRNSISNHRSSHILALGVTDWIDASGSVEEICGAIRAKGGISIAAHPVSTRKFEKQTLHLWDRREELASHFDAWEVASGTRLFDEVLASGLPVVASSDLHRRDQFSSWKTVFFCAREWESVRDSIRSQNLSVRYFDETGPEQPKEWLSGITHGVRLASGIDRRVFADVGRCAFPAAL